MKQVEIGKINSQIIEMMTRTEKMSSENKYYPLTVGSIATLLLLLLLK
jgi:hypothetical protein